MTKLFLKVVQISKNLSILAICSPNKSAFLLMKKVNYFPWSEEYILLLDKSRFMWKIMVYSVNSRRL